MDLKFEPITVSQSNSSSILTHIIEETQKLYSKYGFKTPWIGYLAKSSDGKYVGTCAFKTPPFNEGVEIAYFTFPEFEGQGVAYRMARHLATIGSKADPGVEIFAQTLPEPNASNHILKKMGFVFIGEVEHPEDGLVWEWALRRKKA